MTLDKLLKNVQTNLMQIKDTIKIYYRRDEQSMVITNYKAKEMSPHESVNITYNPKTKSLSGTLEKKSEKYNLQTNNKSSPKCTSYITKDIKHLPLEELSELENVASLPLLDGMIRYVSVINQISKTATKIFLKGVEKNKYGFEIFNCSLDTESASKLIERNAKCEITAKFHYDYYRSTGYREDLSTVSGIDIYSDNWYSRHPGIPIPNEYNSEYLRKQFSERFNEMLWYNQKYEDKMPLMHIENNIQLATLFLNKIKKR